MNDLMFNEKLYAEIIKTSMLMCDDLGDEREFITSLECIFEIINTLMLRDAKSVSEAWQSMNYN